MELLGEYSYHHTLMINTETRLNRTKRELQGSGSRPIEFASIVELKRKELEKCEEEKARHTQKLAQLYPKVQAEWDAMLRQSPQLPSATPVTQNQPSQADLEPRLLELHRSITTLTDNRLQSEIEALRDSVPDLKHHDNDIQALRDSLDKERQKTQSLEERISQLEQMFQTIKPTVEGQRSSEIDSDINPRISSLEEKLQSGIEEHGKQLADIKRGAPFDATSNTAAAQTAVPGATAEIINIRETLDLHGRDLNSLQQKLDPAVSKVQSLQETTEQASKDYQYVRLLVDRQSVAIENQDKKQKSLEESFSILQDATQDQAKKHSVLDSTVTRLHSEQVDKHGALETTIASLQSNTEGWVKKQESLASGMASLESLVKERLQTQDVQASELASLKSSVKQQQEKSDGLEQKLSSTVQASELSSLQSSMEKHQKKTKTLEQNVASLKTEIAKQPLQEFKKLAEKVEEYPPAADLNRILAEFPSGKELKILVTDVPKLKESVSKLKARKTPPPSTPSTAPAAGSLMTKEAIMQTMDSRFLQMETGIKDGLKGEMSVLFDKFGTIINGVGDRTTQMVTNLGDRVSNMNQELDESKRQAKEAKEVGESLGKRCGEQTTELKNSMASLIEDVKKIRAEAKHGTDDIQFQVESLSSWAKNLNSRQWHDSVAQQIAAYVPAHFNGQLNNLATRVSKLETRGNDSEGANKRRRAANGSPLVVNGAH